MRSAVVKQVPDGRVMVNLGCGTTMHPEWTNIDFSYMAKLRRRPWMARGLHRIGLLSRDRWDRLQTMDPGVIVHDLRHGIPLPDAAADAVYHSHFLEHISREDAPRFLKECHRVLRPGGTLRVVVPDLERLARTYAETLQALGTGGDPTLDQRHEDAIEALLEQMVRREPAGTSLQRPVVRTLERLLRGNADRAGELHRWMYDRYSLTRLLRETGLRDVRQEQAHTSRIPDWSRFCLDVDAEGLVRKPGSLYIEAVR